MFVSFAASRSCHTDFLHVDLSSLVNSKGCNKTRDTWELHLHFWFLFGLFQLYLCVFPRTKADLYSSYQMANCLSKTKEINPEKSACQEAERLQQYIKMIQLLVIRDNKFLFFKKSLLIKFLTVTKLHIVIRSIQLCDQL